MIYSFHELVKYLDIAYMREEDNKYCKVCGGKQIFTCREDCPSGFICIKCNKDKSNETSNNKETMGRVE